MDGDNRKRINAQYNEPERKKSLTKTKTSIGDDTGQTSSTPSTQYYKINKKDKMYERVLREDLISESVTTTESFLTSYCKYGPEGKQYGAKKTQKKNLRKLDVVPKNPKWVSSCPKPVTWDIADKITFLINDTAGIQMARLEEYLYNFATITSKGFKISYLRRIIVILDYLVERGKQANIKPILKLYLANAHKPILIDLTSDIITYVEDLGDYMAFLGYLLLRLEDDIDFGTLSDGVIWQLTAKDKLRGQGTVPLRHILKAAAPMLLETTTRMIGISSRFRYHTFVQIAFLLACDSTNNCVRMMHDNIIENIFYRFNPYFPEYNLPIYDTGPADTEDHNLKIGQSQENLPHVLSLLLILVKTTKDLLVKGPNIYLPCPNEYSLRCFIWAYRVECRRKEHRVDRITFTIIASVLLHCFGNRLHVLSIALMADVLSLAVFTEIPNSSTRANWINSVLFDTSQLDIQFKKVLIFLCVDFIKVFPHNHFLIESQHWILGIMYLLDPALCKLRRRWSVALFEDLRRVALQALVCVIPLMKPDLIRDYELIRRLMWYIEWYTEEPYDLSTLYWCVRVLQCAIRSRKTMERNIAVKSLFDTHGIIIFGHLCHLILEKKTPPIEKNQIMLALILRLLTSSLEHNKTLSCCIYRYIKWPSCVLTLGANMLDVVLYSLEKHRLLSDRFLTSLLNFIWESIVWNKDYREKFVVVNGVYKLLDLISMTHGSVQCLALALVCDITKSGEGIGQLVSWRSKFAATYINPNFKLGCTIATLLASIFREECTARGIRINNQGVIQDLENPLMADDLRADIKYESMREPKSIRKTVCYTASDIAGTRLPKVYSLLYLLSEDLKHKVSIADESYNLYKNITLPCEDEVTLVLCSHYLTLKLTDVWTETKTLVKDLLPEDVYILEEFIQVGKGWTKYIKEQQEKVLQKFTNKADNEESSLYGFLARVRLNTALDALHQIRTISRTEDRARLTFELLHDAVQAHHRRNIISDKIQAPILRTFRPKFDAQNLTGHNIKIGTE